MGQKGKQQVEGQVCAAHGEKGSKIGVPSEFLEEKNGSNMNSVLMSFWKFLSLRKMNRNYPS